MDTENTSKGHYLIGEASRASGVSNKMIRYYESEGLIPPPTRGDNGYRYYGRRDIHRLRFIHRARELGFSMAQTRELLGLWQDRGRRSADVKTMARQHIAELEEKIQRLASMRDTLAHLAEHCQGDQRPDCPILDDLGSTSPPDSKPMDNKETKQ